MSVTKGTRKVGENFVTDRNDMAGQGRSKPIVEHIEAATNPNSRT